MSRTLRLWLGLSCSILLLLLSTVPVAAQEEVYLPSVVAENTDANSASVTVRSAAKPVSKWHYRGDWAYAFYYQFEECGSVEVPYPPYSRPLFRDYSIGLDIFDDWGKDSPGKPIAGAGVSFNLSEYDECDPSGGQYFYGQAPLGNKDFDINATKGTAMVDATVELCDMYAYPTPVCYPATISVAWTAVGEGYPGRSTSVEYFRGCRTVRRHQGQSFDALANGTVLFDDEEFEVSDWYGQISRTHYGHMEFGPGCETPPPPPPTETPPPPPPEETPVPPPAP